MRPHAGGDSERSAAKPRGRPGPGTGTAPRKLADAPASQLDSQPSPDVIVRQEAGNGRGCSSARFPLVGETRLSHQVLITLAGLEYLRTRLGGIGAA